jgi:hypothetical protein
MVCNAATGFAAAALNPRLMMARLMRGIPKRSSWYSLAKNLIRSMETYLLTYSMVQDIL